MILTLLEDCEKKWVWSYSCVFLDHYEWISIHTFFNNSSFVDFCALFPRS